MIMINSYRGIGGVDHTNFSLMIVDLIKGLGTGAEVFGEILLPLRFLLISERSSRGQFFYMLVSVDYQSSWQILEGNFPRKDDNALYDI